MLEHLILIIQLMNARHKKTARYATLSILVA